MKHIRHYNICFSVFIRVDRCLTHAHWPFVDNGLCQYKETLYQDRDYRVWNKKSMRPFILSKRHIYIENTTGLPAHILYYVNGKHWTHRCDLTVIYIERSYTSISQHLNAVTDHSPWYLRSHDYGQFDLNGICTHFNIFSVYYISIVWILIYTNETKYWARIVLFWILWIISPQRHLFK